jgi:two-component system, NtrC family, sensor kinase
VTERFQPNPYLEDARRDVTTTDGERLTKINPEYMTRLLSELLQKENGIKIHMTSLKLTSPANRPDPWEEGTLQKFEHGSKEESGVVGPREMASFRYMAPLKTEETCMTCHEKQGYKVGDIRGGLSVSFPYMPFREAAMAANTRIYAVHIIFFLIAVAIVSLLGKKLIGKIQELQKALSHIKRLEGLLPICSHCKMIRKEGANPRDQASWVPVEIYIGDRTNAEFTHGICPACIKKNYGFLLDDEEEGWNAGSKTT